ncbi:MAG: aldehyde dehydrogenase (NADP(+)) [Bacteroidia bacterium]
MNMQPQPCLPPPALSIAESALQKAGAAFMLYRKIKPERKAGFLRAIASGIELLGDTLILQCVKESNLPAQRLESERRRTCEQLRSFAALVEEGSWVEATADFAQPDKKPLPKPDLRKMLIPLGPVVIFGAANFPLAYSTAGGDTASALAAGCTVVVKAHPAHVQTSVMVAECIRKASILWKIPEDVFQHIVQSDLETGQALVLHPLTAAVGFTGSFKGGYALFQLANNRPRPIPVFAEMSSVNPICILPGILQEQASVIAGKIVNSVLNNMGQFCTKPGLLFVMDDEHLPGFVSELQIKWRDSIPEPMLHTGILNAYMERRSELLKFEPVHMEACSLKAPAGSEGYPTLASVAANKFIMEPRMHTEVFGPFTLLVLCRNQAEMITSLNCLQGQLTGSVFGTLQELKENQALLDSLSLLAGRIIINGVPTGVEVCNSMVHGGPFPASSDSRYSAVGASAIKRFVRPQCYQNFPDELLPEELKDENYKEEKQRSNGMPGQKM